MKPQFDFLLSVCIPTHNRASLLRQTLASIVPQCDDAIEIVILDSASTDGTRDVVVEYQAQFPGISYFYSDKKMGIDVDMAKTVELAKGEYCWLMSSDDAITSDAIRILRNELEHGYEILLCNRIVCDLHLKPVRNRSWLRNNPITTVFNLHKREELLSYLHAAVEFGSIFSYMSALVFKREEWNRTEYDDAFTGSGYGHVVRIFGIISNGGRLKYIEHPLVLNRSFNDSFAEMGITRRFMLDIDGYLSLAMRFFPKDETVQRAFLRVMTLEHPWYQIVKLRAYTDNKKDWRDIRGKLSRCGYADALLGICGFLAKAKILVKIAVRFRYIYNTSIFHKYIYLFKKLVKG